MMEKRRIKLLALALVCVLLLASLLSCGATDEPAAPAQAGRADKGGRS